MRRFLPSAAVLGIVSGGIFHFAGLAAWGNIAWAATTAIILVSVTTSSVRSLIQGKVGVDLIALLAMTGALILQEFLAGAIIALMVTGGEALEDYAARRARRELTALLARAPREAHKKVGDAVKNVPLGEVERGDVLLVKPGEVVPVDGVALGPTVLDESALTGEARPIQVASGGLVRSGATSGGAFDLRASAPAAESTYAGIIRLVEAASESKAPFVRLADQYAIWFLLVTVVISGGAWLWSGDPVRALAVLVVATPCPLILAAPAALVSGVSRAARHGIIMKGAGPLEQLARAEILLIDKTGTVTSARPKVAAVEGVGGRSADELLRLAASLEQASVHPYAPAVVEEAQRRGLELSFPDDVVEEPGSGIRGLVDDQRIAVGRPAFVAPDHERPTEIRALELRAELEGSSAVHVAIGGEFAGALLLQDPVRPDAPRALRELRRAGIRDVHLVTGDHPDVAEPVGNALGVDKVHAELSPGDKVAIVRELRKSGIVAMVGDGVNDAPALAQADVGIAMGARGATAASEAADVVLTSDRLSSLVAAFVVSRRTRRIALQSVFVGMGLSLVAMGFAAAGYLSPVVGALLQEGIDVLVILNALRALSGPPLGPRVSEAARQIGRDLEIEHGKLRPQVEALAALAGSLASLPKREALTRLRGVRVQLEGGLLPHELEEQSTAYPIIATLSATEDPTGPLLRTHQEIQRLARLYGRLVDQLSPEGPTPEQVQNLQRVLYGLHAILNMHFGQEEEVYSILDG